MIGSRLGHPFGGSARGAAPTVAQADPNMHIMCITDWLGNRALRNFFLRFSDTLWIDVARSLCLLGVLCLQYLAPGSFASLQCDDLADLVEYIQRENRWPKELSPIQTRTDSPGWRAATPVTAPSSGRRAFSAAATARQPLGGRPAGVRSHPGRWAGERLDVDAPPEEEDSAEACFAWRWQKHPSDRRGPVANVARAPQPWEPCAETIPDGGQQLPFSNNATPESEADSLRRASSVSRPRHQQQLDNGSGRRVAANAIRGRRTSDCLPQDVLQRFACQGLAQTSGSQSPRGRVVPAPGLFVEGGQRRGGGSRSPSPKTPVSSMEVPPPRADMHVASQSQHPRSRQRTPTEVRSEEPQRGARPSQQRMRQERPAAASRSTAGAGAVQVADVFRVSPVSESLEPRAVVNTENLVTGAEGVTDFLFGDSSTRSAPVAGAAIDADGGSGHLPHDRDVSNKAGPWGEACVAKSSRMGIDGTVLQAATSKKPAAIPPQILLQSQSEEQEARVSPGAVIAEPAANSVGARTATSSDRQRQSIGEIPSTSCGHERTSGVAGVDVAQFAAEPAAAISTSAFPTQAPNELATSVCAGGTKQDWESLRDARQTKGGWAAEVPLRDEDRSRSGAEDVQITAEAFAGDLPLPGSRRCRSNLENARVTGGVWAAEVPLRRSGTSRSSIEDVLRPTGGWAAEVPLRRDDWRRTSREIAQLTRGGWVAEMSRPVGDRQRDSTEEAKPRDTDRSHGSMEDRVDAQYEATRTERWATPSRMTPSRPYGHDAFDMASRQEAEADSASSTPSSGLSLGAPWTCGAGPIMTRR